MVLMTVFAVIPVKTLLRSKTRLSEVLTSRERETFTLTMLEDVLKAVSYSQSVQQIVVVSSDSRVQGFANDFGVAYLPEKKPGLNQALEQAMSWCIQNKAKSVLILAADIPLLRPDDVDQIVNLGSEETCIVIAPSRNGGTNGLFQKPPKVIPPCFGSGSLSRHLTEASKKGIKAKVYDVQNIMMDIDYPEDLEDLLRIDAYTASHIFLKQIGMDTRLRKE